MHQEYILDDDECPLAILMNHPSTRGKNLLLHQCFMLSCNSDEQFCVYILTTIDKMEMNTIRLK